MPRRKKISSKSSNFIISLRDYQKMGKPPGSKDFFRKSQFLLPLQENIKIANLAKLQKRLISRLVPQKSPKQYNLI